jgi:hypothetical protein
VSTSDLQRAVFYKEKGEDETPEVSLKLTVRTTEVAESIGPNPPITAIVPGLRSPTIREGVAKRGASGIALGDGPESGGFEGREGRRGTSDDRADGASM